MADIEITLEGTEELLNNLKRIDAGIRGEVALKAVTAGGDQILGRAIINAPVKTANLRNSAKNIGRNTADGAESEIGFRGLAYAKIQEFGGTIYPRSHKYLSWIGDDGKRHFAKHVKLDGKHYLQRAIDSEKSNAVDAMGDVIKSFLGN